MQWLSILSAISNIQLVIKYINQLHPRKHECTVFSSNQKMVETIKKFKREGMTIGDYDLPHNEIILQIIQELNTARDSQIYIKLVYNQPNPSSEEEDPPIIDRTSQLLLHVRQLIKAGRIAVFDPHDEEYSYPASFLQIYINDTPSDCKTYRKLTNAYNSQAIRTYMQMKYQWSAPTFNSIWWKIHGAAMEKLTPQYRQKVSKFLFEQLATNTREVHIHKYRSRMCEACGLCDEDNDHVLQCTQLLRVEAKEAMMKEIEDYFIDTCISEGTRICFITGITAWLNKTEMPALQQIVTHASVILRQAYIEQSIIGWNHLIRGRFSKSWEKLIQYDIDNKQPPPRGRRKRKQIISTDIWGRKLILLLWKHVTTMWDVRNSTIHAIYKAGGSTREHELLILAAENECDRPGTLAVQDTPWIAQATGTFRSMHPMSLQYWIRNIQKVRKWFMSQPRQVEGDEQI